eukprot:1145349-Pelagomonas_calceolata.AAC.14
MASLASMSTRRRATYTDDAISDPQDQCHGKPGSYIHKVTHSLLQQHETDHQHHDSAIPDDQDHAWRPCEREADLLHEKNGVAKRCDGQALAAARTAKQEQGEVLGSRSGRSVMANSNGAPLDQQKQSQASWPAAVGHRQQQ